MSIYSKDQPDPAATVEALVIQTRHLRGALHDLVLRMQQDRLQQEHDLVAMLRSPRLTTGQRQRLQDRGARRRT